MATASANDPFYLVRDTLETEVRQLRVKFDQWKVALDGLSSASDLSFNAKHDDLRRDLVKAEEMCRKVRQAVVNVAQNRARFPHIDDGELNNRKQFVESLDRALAFVKDGISGRETMGRLEYLQRQELHSRQDAVRQDAARQQNSYTRANADFMGHHQQQQDQVRREQDVTLDKMGSALDRLGDMAREMDAELQEQDKIIEDVDRKVDEAQGKMDHAIKQVEKLLQTKDKCQLATIGILVGLFIITAMIAFMRLTN